MGLDSLFERKLVWRTICSICYIVIGKTIHSLFKQEFCHFILLFGQKKVPETKKENSQLFSSEYCSPLNMLLLQAISLAFFL